MESYSDTDAVIRAELDLNIKKKQLFSCQMEKIV
jgi:hypothetical protein